MCFALGLYLPSYAMATFQLLSGTALAAGDANRESCNAEFPGVEALQALEPFLPIAGRMSWATPPDESGQPVFGSRCGCRR